MPGGGEEGGAIWGGMVNADCCRKPDCAMSLSDGRTTSGLTPMVRNSARIASAVAKSLSRFACTHWSNMASVPASYTGRVLKEPKPVPCQPTGAGATSLSAGLKMSGSTPIALSSARMASAVAKSLSRFACTHRSSVCSVAISTWALPCHALSDGRTMSGSMSNPLSSERIASAVEKSLSRFATTQLSKLASIIGSNLCPA
mmetsp:Transcript_81674/g.221618  ORF Transcript_81674/g.221618 Transcript_81674/m.221618 type:complete len:201 (-) Transcript_81674:863-1465(-)